MKMKWFTFLILTTFVPAANAQKKEIIFDIIFKDDRIGVLKASEEVRGNQTIKNINAQSDTKILAFSVHVESELYVVHEDGELLKGTAYRHASRGSEDVHSHTEKSSSGPYQRERNAQKELLTEKITICVADLYFKEPTAVTKVYSNMYAQFITLKMVSKGKYQLTTPDNKKSYFTYQNGKLVMMEVETPVGKVLTKRV